MQQGQQVSGTELMIDDLGRQVAEKAIGEASWKARALIAESNLAEIQQVMAAEAAEKEASEDEDAPVLSVVEDLDDDDDAEDAE